MNKPVSDRQRLANRRSARRSTGPRTPAGKARSAQNALTHGLLARDVVITDGDGAENPADYDALLNDLRHELDPRTRLEHALVECVAAGLWRLRRAQRHEVGAIRQSLDECRRPDPDPNEEQVLKLQKRLDPRIADRDARRYSLESLRHPPDPATPEFSQLLHETAAYLRLDAGGIAPADLLPAVIRAEESDIQILESEITALNAEIASLRRYQNLRQDRRSLVAALPPDANLTRLLRYESMIDRQIHRALAELRRRRADRERFIARRSPRNPKSKRRPPSTRNSIFGPRRHADPET